MDRFAIVGVIFLIGSTLIAAAYYEGKDTAQTECAARQAAADRRDYGEIIARMADEGVDLDSPDAVDSFLRELAGEPIGAE